MQNQPLSGEYCLASLRFSIRFYGYLAKISFMLEYSILLNFKIFIGKKLTFSLPLLFVYMLCRVESREFSFLFSSITQILFCRLYLNFSVSFSSLFVILCKNKIISSKSVAKIACGKHSNRTFFDEQTAVCPRNDNCWQNIRYEGMRVKVGRWEREG